MRLKTTGDLRLPIHNKNLKIKNSIISCESFVISFASPPPYASCRLHFISNIVKLCMHSYNIIEFDFDASTLRICQTSFVFLGYETFTFKCVSQNGLIPQLQVNFLLFSLSKKDETRRSDFIFLGPPHTEIYWP